jgi:hypothetical protein
MMVSTVFFKDIRRVHNIIVEVKLPLASEGERSCPIELFVSYLCVTKQIKNEYRGAGGLLSILTMSMQIFLHDNPAGICHATE